MAASRPPFPIYVLNHDVNTADLTGKPPPSWRGGEWSEIPCASRRAYGCGDSIQEAVEGLVLYACLGDAAPHLTSSLAIRMTEGALRRFESELDPDYYRRRRDADELPSYLIARGRVVMAEEHGVTVIVLNITSPAFSFEQPDLLYYLVYDSMGKSLSMFQILPHPCEGVYECLRTLRPIVPKRTDGGDDDYKLFLLGYDEERSSSDQRDVFWLGSLSPSDATAVPSKVKTMDFPPGLIHKPFKVDVAFSCQGKCFWGDLKQGLLYCDLQTSDFGFVKLPCEYKVTLENGDEALPVRNTRRTMGCVGDSILFVCIDVPSHYTSAVVCIWELQLPLPGEQQMGNRKRKRTEVQWKEVEKVPAKVLWELPSFKDSGLPPAPFQYPILTPDAALCFVLVDQSFFPRRRPFDDHFCIFDIRYKRLLWHGRVHNYPITEYVIVYPSSNFLSMNQCSRDRSCVEHCPAPELEAMEQDSAGLV